MRVLARLLVTLVVVAVLAVAADRGAAYYAEQKAASALSGTLGTEPDVDIHGFPFVTQWGTGAYEGATVSADQVSVGGTEVTDFTVTVSDVRTPAYARTQEDVLASTAGSVRMSGVAPYSGLPLPSGVTAKRHDASSDDMRLSGTVKAFGQSVRFKAVVAVSLGEDGNARLKPRKVDVLGPLASGAVTALVRDRLSVSFAPPGLPVGMKVTSLKVTDDGLRVTASGNEISAPKE